MEEGSNIETIIKRVVEIYRFNELKEQQRVIAGDFLSGRDVFGCLPTGFGKSICYLLLPRAFDLLRKRPEGTCIIIVIAPLTSLMEDQVESCTRRGIKAVAVTSEEESRKNYGDVVNGLYQIVYISPEMIIGTQKWRTTLQDDLYQSKLRAVVVDEAHCVKKWGESFRREFKRIRELRSILPSNLNIMALTATAPKTLRTEVCHKLGMINPSIVELSPDKPNVYLACKEFVSLMNTFVPVADELRKQRTRMGRVIVFCKQIPLCNQIYSLFVYLLGDEFTEPPSKPISIPKYRLVDKFTSGTHEGVKKDIVRNFTSPESPLRVVIATVAFGMGIDCPDIRQVIHMGPPEDIESYIQQIGRSGRDMKPSCALMLYGPNLMRNSSDLIKKYCVQNTLCRRNFLYQDFESYKYGSVFGCVCCDVCQKTCTCSCSDEKNSDFIL